MNLENKVSIITGGSKGIGYAIAEAMLAEGMKVLITGRNEQSLENAFSMLEEKHGDKIARCVSDSRILSDEINVKNKAIELWGKIDVVIANAGVGHFSPIDEMEEDDWSKVIDTNLTGVFNTTKATVQELKSSQGYLITVASLAGTNFFAGGAAYNASKFGLVGFTQAVMLDLRKYGVKVTTIMPGSVATYFNDRIPGDGDAWKIQPEDLGQIVIDLLKMHPRTLPSKIEVRPSIPPSK